MKLRNVELIVELFNIFRFREIGKTQLHHHGTFNGNLSVPVKQRWESFELRKSSRKVITVPHCPKSPQKMTGLGKSNSFKCEW